MDGKKSVKLFLKDNWLFLLIVLQPVLDVLAYWTQGGDATFAGYIRLLIMLALPLHLLITLKKKRNFIIAMAAIGICCLLHIANGFRVGYISMFFDYNV